MGLRFRMRIWLFTFTHPKARSFLKRCYGSSALCLLKYDEKLEGVLLAYEANIIDESARILSGVHPYFGVTINAKLLLFSPKPNMLLEGKVVKLRKESIHVIVLGFASAVVITGEDIRDEFKHRTNHGEGRFVSRVHKNHVIKVGTMVSFLVKSFYEEILHISGSLVPSHTGSIHWLEKNSVTNRIHCFDQMNHHFFLPPTEINSILF